MPQLPPARRAAFRFHHISTDEVFGALGPDDAPFDETTRVRSAQPLLGEQGGVRPSGARLVPHLWAADHRLEHRQQLRAVAIPGEADPAGHAERAGRQAPAGLWRRLQPAATGSSSRTTPRRWCACWSRASPAPPTRSARGSRAATSGGAGDLRRTGPPPARSRRTARAADPFRHRPTRARFPLRDRSRRGPRRRWPGPRRTISRPAWRAPSTGIWHNRDWWQAVRARRYAGQRLGTAA